MKHLFPFFLLLLVSSCVSRKACERKFPAFDSVSRVVNTVTVYRDTTVNVMLPGDTVWRVSDTLDGVSELRTPLARSFAWFKDGMLWHRLEEKDTAVPATIRSAIRTTWSTSDKSRISHKTEYINRLTGWQWFQVWAGRVLLGLVLGFLILRYFRDDR